MRKRKREGAGVGTQLRNAAVHPYRTALSFTPMGTPELRLYRAMREAIPVLDAAILKLVRLTGGFTVRCADRQAELVRSRLVPEPRIEPFDRLLAQGSIVNHPITPKRSRTGNFCFQSYC